MNWTSDRQNGFALLLTMIVISVVLAIGLSLLNITLKQFTLSSTARDSETAFHAANTGLDCIRYHRARYYDAYNQNNFPAATCAGSSDAPTNATSGEMFGGIYEFNTSGANGPACVQVSIYTSNSSNAIDRALNNEGLERFECPAGTVCTMIFSRGFNRACSDLGSVRTVQRELTLTY